MGNDISPSFEQFMIEERIPSMDEKSFANMWFSVTRSLFIDGTSSFLLIEDLRSTYRSSIGIEDIYRKPSMNGISYFHKVPYLDRRSSLIRKRIMVRRLYVYITPCKVDEFQGIADQWGTG